MELKHSFHYTTHGPEYLSLCRGSVYASDTCTCLVLIHSEGETYPGLPSQYFHPMQSKSGLAHSSPVSSGERDRQDLTNDGVPLFHFDLECTICFLRDSSHR